MSRRVMFLMVGLVSVLGVISGARAYDHVLTDGVAVFQDDFEDGVWTDKWVTWAGTDADFTEADGACRVQVTTGHAYTSCHFYTQDCYNFFEKKTEFTLNYFDGTTFAWSRLYLLNTQHPFGKGFGIFFLRYTNDQGNWKSQVKLYEMRNGPSVQLYDSGLVVGMGAVSFSLMLDKNQYEFYWNGGAGGTTTLRSSGTHSLTAAEIGTGLYMSTGIETDWLTGTSGVCGGSYDAFVYRRPAVHGVVDPVRYVGDKSSIYLQFQFQPLAGGDNFTRMVMLASDGSFQVDDIPAGDYRLVVTGDCWLDASVSASVHEADVDLGTISLEGADANGDNAVTFEDFSILQNNYGERGGAAAAVTPRTTVAHAVDGVLSAGEWTSLYSDPISDKPTNGCVELARWGAEVRDGILYGALELDPAGHDVAYYDDFGAGNRLWLGLWIDADPVADPVTGVAGGDDQFAPPRVQDLNIELGMDNGSLVCRTADWNSLNFWGRDSSFNNITPVTVNAAYQGHVVEFAVPVADILAELARTDGAVPGNVWKIGARAAGHVSGDDYAGDITDLQSVTVSGIEGRVVIEGYLGDKTIMGATFQLTPTSGGVSNLQTALLDADGVFRLDPVPAGTYDITVKSSNSLSAVLSSVSVGTSVTDLGTIELKNGDINGDDRVSFEDFSILQNNYGDSGAAASPLAALTGGCGGLGIALLSFLGLAMFALRPRNE